MNVTLPDIGDLLFGMALLFGALIIIFETLERRLESRREQILLDEIAREYAVYRRMGHF